MTTTDAWWRQQDTSSLPGIRAAVELFTQRRPESIWVILQSLIQMVESGELDRKSLPIPLWVLQLTALEYETYEDFNSEDGFNPQTRIVVTKIGRWDDLELDPDEPQAEFDDCTCYGMDGYGATYHHHDPDCPIHGVQSWSY